MDGWCPKTPEEGIRFPGTEVTDGCESPWGWWELNLGLLQKPVFLTTEPSFQPYNCYFKISWGWGLVRWLSRERYLLPSLIMPQNSPSRKEPTLSCLLTLHTPLFKVLVEEKNSSLESPFRCFANFFSFEVCCRVTVFLWRCNAIVLGFLHCWFICHVLACTKLNKKYHVVYGICVSVVCTMGCL